MGGSVGDRAALHFFRDIFYEQRVDVCGHFNIVFLQRFFDLLGDDGRSFEKACTMRIDPEADFEVDGAGGEFVDENFG